MKLFSIAAAAAALTIALPATAHEAVGANQEAEKAEKKDADQKKICRVLKTTGSRMGDRVCLTKEQWDKVDEDK